MTEAEAIEALSDIAANAATYFSVFISLTFAYLTVAYLVGSVLSRFQLILITSIYLLSATMMGLTTTVWTRAWLHLYDREETIISGSWVAEFINWEVTLSILLTVVVLASVYFMYDIRKHASRKSLESGA